MIYTYSICHPEKYKIEYPEKELNRNGVLEMITHYSWLDILKSMDDIPDDKIHYSPSLDFENLSDSRNLGITATLENGKPEFSLWYKRPVKSRTLHGILTGKVEMEVIDKWDFSLEKALEYYHIFLNRDYEELEKLMKKNSIVP